MKIRCESCSIEHELDPPAWVVSSGRPFRFRCSSCGHSQMVTPSSPASAAHRVPSEPSAAAAAAEPPPAAALGAAGTPPVDPNAPPPVYLKQEGKVYLVRDWATVQRWIMERRVDREDLVSEGGVRWEPIGMRPELGSFFAAVEQLDATETQPTTTTATPTPAPFSSTPFPFGGGDEPESGASGRFGRLDDDTEGVPTGLPPLPTEEVFDPAGPDEEADYPEIPPARRREGFAAETLPAELVAKLGPNIDLALLRAETLSLPPDDIAPPALGTPAPIQRTSTAPPRPSETATIPPTEPSDEFALPDESGHAAHGDLAAKDLFDEFESANNANVELDEWADEARPAGGLPRWLFPVVGAVTVLAAVAIMAVLMTSGGSGAHPAALTGADDGAELQGLLDPPAKVAAAPTASEAKATGDEASTAALAQPAEATAASAGTGEEPAPPTPAEPVAEPVEEPGPEPQQAATPAPRKASPPASVDKLVERGWSSVDSGNLKGAAAQFEKAVAIDPEHPDANFGYGYVLVRMSQRDLATKHLCRALGNGGGSSDVGREAKGQIDTHGLTCP